MRKLISIVLLSMMLSACSDDGLNEKQAVPAATVDTSAAAGDQQAFEHNPAVSDQAILVSRQASVAYQQCLGEQLKIYVQEAMDVRDATTLIMRECESRFDPIRNQFAKENVPAGVTNKYLRTKRNRSTPNLLRTLMFAQSQRQAQAAAKAE